LSEEIEPVSVKVIHEKLKSKITKGTLYRTLDDLLISDLITRTNLDPQKARYELTFGKKHHHHAICTSCGEVEDVKMCNAIDFNDEARKDLRKFRAVRSHSLEFFGLCRKCEPLSR
jgi:Fur family ferric uptake transcriptional regulator